MRQFAIIVAGVLAIGAPAVDAQRSALTPSEIDAAINWGVSGEAAPYALPIWTEYVRGVPVVNPPSLILGAVYTPFVRVALAAKAARQSNTSLTPEDGRRMAEPLVYVAFRWSCCDDEHGITPETFNPFTPFDYHIAVPGDPPEASRWHLSTPPVWVNRNVALLDAFGGAPYPDVVFVAAYPLTVLSTPTDFIIYRQVESRDATRRIDIRVGRATAKELSQWR